MAHKWVSDNAGVVYKRIVARVVEMEKYCLFAGEWVNGRASTLSAYRPQLWVLDALDEHHLAFMDDYGSIWTEG